MPKTEFTKKNMSNRNFLATPPKKCVINDTWFLRFFWLNLEYQRADGNMIKTISVSTKFLTELFNLWVECYDFADWNELESKNVWEYDNK